MMERPSRWKVVVLVVLVVLIAASDIAAIALIHGPSGGVPRQFTIPERDCGLLKHFPSLDALKAHLRASPVSWPWIFGDARMLGTTGPAAESAGSAAYSGTNNQVDGVDEADIVKTDGAYIYSTIWNAFTYGNEVAIVRAYPPETAGLVAKIPVESWVQGLFVDGDRLAVITAGGFGDFDVLSGGSVPGPGHYRSQTRVLTYDISEPSAPALVRNVTVSGSYVGARLIGDVAYLVVQDYLYLMDDGASVVLPTVWTDGVARDLKYSDIGYFSDSAGSSADTLVLSVNLRTVDPPSFESFLTRGAYQLYMSPTNVYVAGVEWESTSDGRVVAETSTVHKVAVEGGNVQYVCSARVPGTILNQFSMDESGGYLRVATTLGQWGPEGQQTSAGVYTFDSLLNPLGNLAGLASGERMFAARFIGSRAYLVTFRRIDPLFVIDVSDPRAPRVLGELKIAGVSEYLHPYDATHLIGLGLADPSGTGRVHGLKLSLFDVADVEHPSEVSSFAIGTGETEWAWSEATYDHKAFLFLPQRSLLAIPVGISEWSDTSTRYWQGTYAFDVSPQSFEGFSLLGTISHQDTTDGSDFWRFQVRRSLTIGDVLYTVSAGLVLGASMESFAEVARVPL